MKLKVAIIDYGIGNVHSVVNAVDRLGYWSIVTRDEKEMQKCQALVLPGVGAFGKGMENIRKFNLENILNEEVVNRKKPILGICLGMQLLADSSEESPGIKGFGWIPGHVKLFGQSANFKVPHVGWDEVRVSQDSPLFTKWVEGKALVYFDHSYHYVCDSKYVSGICDYGVATSAVIQRDNIFGVQFHPEKSQNTGLKLLRGFFNSIK